jgi:hypothetical protein
VAFFRIRSKDDRHDTAGSALSVWQLEEPAASAAALAEPPARQPQAGPPESKPHGPEDSRLNRELEEIESRHVEALGKSQRALEEAGHVLSSLEEGAGDAESHARRTEWLADEMAKYREQEAEFQALIEKISAAERRALEAEQRTQAALARIPKRRRKRSAPSPTSRGTSKPKTKA